MKRVLRLGPKEYQKIVRMYVQGRPPLGRHDRKGRVDLRPDSEVRLVLCPLSYFKLVFLVHNEHS